MTPLTQDGALKRIKGLRSALSDLEAGLNGDPFKWGDIDGKYKLEALRKCDLQLMTKDGLERMGLVLRNGESPVGTCFSYAGCLPMNLYLVGTQAQSKRKRKTS